MDVDEAWRDGQPARVDFLDAAFRQSGAEGRDAAAADREIAFDAGCTQAVEDQAVADDEVGLTGLTKPAGQIGQRDDGRRTRAKKYTTRDLVPPTVGRQLQGASSFSGSTSGDRRTLRFPLRESQT